MIWLIRISNTITSQECDISSIWIDYIIISVVCSSLIICLPLLLDREIDFFCYTVTCLVVLFWLDSKISQFTTLFTLLCTRHYCTGTIPYYEVCYWSIRSYSGGLGNNERQLLILFCKALALYTDYSITFVFCPRVSLSLVIRHTSPFEWSNFLDALFRGTKLYAFSYIFWKYLQK